MVARESGLESAWTQGKWVAMTWVLVGLGVVMVAAVAMWVLRSFRIWGPTDSERHGFLWGRRGGGDF